MQLHPYTDEGVLISRLISETRERGWDLTPSDDDTVIFKWTKDNSVIYVRYLDSAYWYERYDFPSAHDFQQQEATWEIHGRDAVADLCAYRQSEERLFIAIAQIRSLLLHDELPASGGPMTSDENPTHQNMYGNICMGEGLWSGSNFKPTWDDDGNSRQCVKCGWTQEVA